MYQHQPAHRTAAPPDAEPANSSPPLWDCRPHVHLDGGDPGEFELLTLLAAAVPTARVDRWLASGVLLAHVPMLPTADSAIVVDPAVPHTAEALTQEWRQAGIDAEIRPGKLRTELDLVVTSAAGAWGVARYLAAVLPDDAAAAYRLRRILALAGVDVLVCVAPPWYGARRLVYLGRLTPVDAVWILHLLTGTHPDACGRDLQDDAVLIQLAAELESHVQRIGEQFIEISADISHSPYTPDEIVINNILQPPAVHHLAAAIELTLRAIAQSDSPTHSALLPWSPPLGRAHRAVATSDGRGDHGGLSHLREGEGAL